jgi:peroxiredoxin
MKQKSILLIAVLALVTFFVSSSASSAKDSFAVGSTMDNFKLSDTNGKEQSFNDLKGKNGAIIVFLSVQCPVVKGYNERISKLADDYKAKGINVIGINSNSTETLDKVKTHAAENYKFPVLIDKNNILADRFGANVTPEMFYFNAKNVLTYHGAIDNDRSGKNVTTDFLRTALDESLSGKAVTKSTANAFGCSIKRAEKN